MKLITWNTAHRSSRAREQVAILLERHPDIIALQEVTPSSGRQLADLLLQNGFGHITVSDRCDSPDKRISRSYGVLVASRLPMSTLNPQLPLPWKEKSLSVIIHYRGIPVELHTVHVPPGSSNGWTKVECLEAVYRGLAATARQSRVLCGDFNAPQSESSGAAVITWGQRLGSNGNVRTRRRIRGGSGDRWDAAERNILIGLSEYDLTDVFRSLHGYGVPEYSWNLNRRGMQVKRRFDHVFASKDMHPLSCRYLHEVDGHQLSDHTPLEVEFHP